MLAVKMLLSYRVLLDLLEFRGCNDKTGKMVNDFRHKSIACCW